MRTFLLLIVFSGAWLVFAGCTAPVVPPSERSYPPPTRQNLPGEVKGRIKTWWLAPFVSVTTRSIGRGRTTTVQWYTPDGKRVRDLAGPNVEAHPVAFVSEYGEGKEAIHAVNGDWKITLPQKAGPAGYITCTEDSRTFVHEFHPQKGEILCWQSHYVVFGQFHA